MKWWGLSKQVAAQRSLILLWLSKIMLWMFNYTQKIMHIYTVCPSIKQTYDKIVHDVYVKQDINDGLTWQIKFIQVNIKMMITTWCFIYCLKKHVFNQRYVYLPSHVTTLKNTHLWLNALYNVDRGNNSNYWHRKLVTLTTVIDVCGNTAARTLEYHYYRKLKISRLKENNGRSYWLWIELSPNGDWGLGMYKMMGKRIESQKWLGEKYFYSVK